jgi:ketosteroid isomerase-like protein
MAQQNVDLIRQLYAAFARGDAGAVLGAFDPEIEWNEAENIAYADRNPYRGPQQVAEGVFGRLMTEWDGFSVTPRQFVADAETVVVTGRYGGKYKASGLPLDAQFVHVWTIRNGKVVAFQQYADTLQFSRVMARAAV